MLFSLDPFNTHFIDKNYIVSFSFKRKLKIYAGNQTKDDNCKQKKTKKEKA